jgi:hypothetical protein
MFHSKPKVMSLCIVAAALLLCAGLVASQDSQPAKVAGMLVGIDEDANGNFTRVYLEDDSIGNILVADDEKGAELVAKAGTQVEITGTLVDQVNGDYALLIYVKNWAPLTENQPDTIDPE